MPRPHTRRPAPTKSGKRTPSTGPKNGQRGGGERLTPDAPHNGVRHPPQGRPPATSSAQRRVARALAVEPVIGPHANRNRARETRATGPGRPPQGRAPGTGSA